jgi:hypothetical protein
VEAGVIWQIDFPSAWSAVLRQDKAFADIGLLLGSALAGGFLLMAVIGSHVLPIEHAGICLILALLSALAVVDRALKTFPVNRIDLAPGLALSLLAVVMLFHH